MFGFPIRLVLESAFGDHPYGHRIEDSEAGLRRVTAHALRTMHEQRISSRSPWLFVVGDVQPEHVTQLAGDALAGHGITELSGPNAEWPVSPEYRIIERETAQTAIAIAFPGPTRNEPDALALRVFANAVSGLGGALFEDLRSRRSLAYTVSAFPVTRPLGGAFAGYIATSPDRADEARHELIRGLARLAEAPLSVEDVVRAQRYTIGARWIQTQTNGALLDQLANACMLGRGLDEIRDFEARVNAMTPESIRDAATRWIEPSRVVVAEVRGTGASR
jgi:zinc protease